jgi:hypothetical protein
MRTASLGKKLRRKMVKMYKNKFVLVVYVNGKPVQDKNGYVELPEGTEYTLRFRNKHDCRALVCFTIDDEDASGTGYIIPANDYIDIERFASTPKKFKLVSLESDEAIDYGKNGWQDGTKGLVKATFYFEKEKSEKDVTLEDLMKEIEELKKRNPYPVYPVPYNPWPYRRRDWWPIDWWDNNDYYRNPIIYGENTTGLGWSAVSENKFTINTNDAVGLGGEDKAHMHNIKKAIQREEIRDDGETALHIESDGHIGLGTSNQNQQAHLASGHSIVAEQPKFCSPYLTTSSFQVPSKSNAVTVEGSESDQEFKRVEFDIDYSNSTTVELMIKCKKDDPRRLEIQEKIKALQAELAEL